jgi:hypothetical protein
MKRIKHNDLLPWFTEDHNTLPPAYMKSCKEFFGDSSSSKLQAASRKHQAASGEQKGKNVRNFYNFY